MKRTKRVLALFLTCLMALSFVGCGFQVSRDIAKVNGRPVTEAEFNYYLEFVKQQMLTSSGTTDTESFWDAEIDGVKASEAAKNRALEELFRVEIACIKAEEKGLSVDDATMSSIRSWVNSTEATQKEQIDFILSETGLSSSGLVDLVAKTELANKLASDIYATTPEVLTASEEEVKEKFNQEYVRVKHILVMKTGEGDETKKALAEEIAAKAKGGANFDSLVTEYGEDPGMEQSPDGYTFTRGTMVPEFENASYALAVGEVSDPVESSYGYHIIKKYALPSNGESYDTAIAEVNSVLAQERYNKLLDSYKSEVEIEIKQNILDKISVK